MVEAGGGTGGNGVCRGCALRGNWSGASGEGIRVTWGHSYWESGCLGVTVISDLISGVIVVRIWGY